MNRVRTYFFHSFLLLTAFAFGACRGPIPVPPPTSFPAEYAQSGRELTHGLAACGYCHGDRSEPGALLSGGRVMEDRYGEVVAPNLTTSRSGIGSWGVQEITDAIRTSMGPEGRVLAAEHHAGYQWLSDDDVYRIVAYLRTQPPVESDYPVRELGFVERYTTGFLEQRKEVEGVVPSLKGTAVAIYGQYLVEHVARCDSCHTTPGDFMTEERYLQGGKEIRRDGAIRVAPNITGSEVFGIGAWSREEIVRYLKTGQAPGNRRTDPEFCPTNFFGQAKQKDLEAIAEYLLTTETAAS